MAETTRHQGILHAFVAFDWGDSIDLERARVLQPAELHALPRRRRTPSSFNFHPSPLRTHLPDVRLALPEIGDCQAEAVATLFDFAAVSLDLNVPFDLDATGMVKLADWLADPLQIVAVARSALMPLYQRLKPAIRSPSWHDTMVEEYFVFQMTQATGSAKDWLSTNNTWLGNVLRLEHEPLSEDETADALRLRLSYSPEDVFVPDSGAAILRDHDCEETLQAIEFANLQLLELRHIDDRLDGILIETEKIFAKGSPRILPWHGPSQKQKLLGEMSVEASTLFERSTNALKLVGDTYLARVYRLLAERFRLSTWETGIQRKLDTLEGIYEVVTDRAEASRSTVLELIVITLIAVELILAFVKH
ncbi:MAG: hypothetical protein QM703_02615 [Gemmatales bacterium]